VKDGTAGSFAGADAGRNPSSAVKRFGRLVRQRALPVRTFVREFLGWQWRSRSLGLQYGVPLDEYVDAFTFTRFEPAGPVQAPGCQHGGSRPGSSV
jgi:hypothetical protein